MRYISIILLLLTFTSRAIDAPVKLLRACIDIDNLNVTISWNTKTDDCGSFTKHEIYGSENGGSYQLLETVLNNATTEYTHSLLSLNTNWKYYIATHKACNGTDTLISDTLDIDTEYPNNISIDSVSYDLNNQHIIAGWTPNPSPDTHGYEISDFSSGDGDSIGYTVNTFFTVSEDPFDRFPIVLATLDSCNLSSLISSPHQPAFLNTSIDTCLNTISLNWSLYSGWASIDSQALFISRNGGLFMKETSFNGTTNSFSFNDFILGDTIEFYIRSYTGTISSSSNKRKTETRKLVKPEYTYIDYVTVPSENLIDLSWSCSPLNDVSSFTIKKSNDGVLYQTLTSINSNQLSLTDATPSTASTSYHYQIVAHDKCDNAIDSSQRSQSILLDIEPNVTHNNYTEWEQGIASYELQKSENGSTWNTIEFSQTPIKLDNDSLSTGCYRILAREEENSRGMSSQSTSNIRCKQDSLAVYVTTAINPNSKNNSFVVSGKGIDHNKSHYLIYNRWGQLMVRNRTDQSWKGSYLNEPVTPGVYLYIVNVIGELGEKQTQKGTIHVLR